MLAVVGCWDVAFVWHEVLVEYKGPEDIMLALQVLAKVPGLQHFPTVVAFDNLFAPLACRRQPLAAVVVHIFRQSRADSPRDTYHRLCFFWYLLPVTHVPIAVLELQMRFEVSVGTGFE